MTADARPIPIVPAIACPRCAGPASDAELAGDRFLTVRFAHSPQCQPRPWTDRERDDLAEQARRQTWTVPGYELKLRRPGRREITR